MFLGSTSVLRYNPVGFPGALHGWMLVNAGVLMLPLTIAPGHKLLSLGKGGDLRPI